MINIIKELRATNSINEKQAILKKHRYNDEWLNYLKDVYNPFITYGKSGDKIGGRDDLENLKLCRSIDAGLTAVTINKIYKNLIPTTAKMMKAKDKCIDQVKWPMMSQYKYDGNYTVIIRRKDSISFFTSGGHEYTHPEVTLDQLPFAGVYLAERVDGSGLLGDRRKTNLLGTKKGALQYCRNSNNFKIFDFLTFSEFNQGKSINPFHIRNVLLKEIEMSHPFKIVDTYNLHSIEDATSFLEGAINLGYEGIVLKSPEMYWRDSKSRRLDFVKFKARHTADLFCVEELAGETASTHNLIGSLLLEDSQGRQVKVGSGLSDNDRVAWNRYKGKVVEIMYEQLMDTYIQPTVVCIRGDKTKEDID